MIFTETHLKDAFIIDLQKIEDERGFFARAYCQKEFAARNIKLNWAQANLAYSKKRGILRGLHFQKAPYAEAKLIRCIRGAMYDVIVDLRPDSPSYMQWLGVELTAENRRALFVPEGFAHGYLTLQDDTEAFYPTSQFYTPGAEGGVRWNDPAFAIEWPFTADLIISEKDQNWPDYQPAA
ncbi:MAG TPA: dTDP-4-dehydrorhamnose 3,5-epimerase [Anaerolineae bacterium]|nr:dTDP-4-dehydrorhamnose 3,5-epimerase [Anaerolineae bacterium]